MGPMGAVVGEGIAVDRTPYLTALEAARLLRVHRQVIYRMCQAGTLPHLRVGRLLRIPETAIRDLQHQERDGQP